MRYLLYNPISGLGAAKTLAENYQVTLSEDAKLIDMTNAEVMASFFEELCAENPIVLFGGDGTLNCFLNAARDKELQNEIYLFGAGTGNDFCLDIGKAVHSEPILISEYTKNLPTVTVKGEERVFINGIGFGIDGYCCEVGDIVRKSGKKPNYTSIAISGLLFHFKPRDAVVTVDGVRYGFKKVWIAPTMYGSHYGGGMIPTPDQKRGGDTLSLMVFHGSGRLKTLTIFPGIFKGEHVKATKHVTILTGKEITVRFDRPTPLQIDGETVLDVTEYTCKI